MQIYHGVYSGRSTLTTALAFGSNFPLPFRLLWRLLAITTPSLILRVMGASVRVKAMQKMRAKHLLKAPIFDQIWKIQVSAFHLKSAFLWVYAIPFSSKTAKDIWYNAIQGTSKETSENNSSKGAKMQPKMRQTATNGIC